MRAVVQRSDFRLASMMSKKLVNWLKTTARLSGPSARMPSRHSRSAATFGGVVSLAAGGPSAPVPAPAEPSLATRRFSSSAIDSRSPRRKSCRHIGQRAVCCLRRGSTSMTLMIQGLQNEWEQFRKIRTSTSDCGCRQMAHSKSSSPSSRALLSRVNRFATSSLERSGAPPLARRALPAAASIFAATSRRSGGTKERAQHAWRSRMMHSRMDM
mmetsp:Transcript_9151/g.37490  ORF Transcript_9151/g.37490 Transcript_9151/m.37490 type:complete len:213 (-) Transcript_9151:2738-3376(-)